MMKKPKIYTDDNKIGYQVRKILYIVNHGLPENWDDISMIKRKDFETLFFDPSVGKEFMSYGMKFRIVKVADDFVYYQANPVASIFQKKDNSMEEI